MSHDALHTLDDLITTLEQGRDLIAALAAEHYACPPDALCASSIGAHYRHHIEHVQLLATGHARGLINYDQRERDPLIERDQQVAIARTNALIDALRDLSAETIAKHVTVAHHTSPDAPERLAPSTLHRELLFLLSHAVHHYAVIKLIAESLGYTLDAHFGVMPSTIVSAQR